MGGGGNNLDRENGDPEGDSKGGGVDGRREAWVCRHSNKGTGRISVVRG